MVRFSSSYFCLATLTLVSALLMSACARSTPAHKRALVLGGDVMRAYQVARTCPTPEAVDKMAKPDGGLCPSAELCLEYRIVADDAGEQCGLAVVNKGHAGDIVLVPSSVWTTVDLIEASAKREAEKAKNKDAL